MCAHLVPGSGGDGVADVPGTGLGGSGVTTGPGSPPPLLVFPATVTLYCWVGSSPVTSLLVSVGPAVTVTTSLVCRFLEVDMGVSVMV